MLADDKKPDRLDGLDFAAHNEKCRRVWELYRRREPIRTPVILGTNTRFFLLDPTTNPQNIQFEEYSENPDLMFDMALRFARWSRFNLLQDAELGLPAKWEIAVDFQNYYEAAWFGCPVHYLRGQVPDTMPAFTDCPERVMDAGMPEPFGGLMSKVRRYHEHWIDRAKREEFLGRPIHVRTPWSGLGSDGPMTVACNLFGADFVCSAMVEEPERLQRLFNFITQATLKRMKAWRAYGGMPEISDDWGFADDSIALISTAMFREHVLPFHRQIFDALCPTGKRSIHLCGNATRHFVTIRDELRVSAFDTGFPVDFTKLRRDIGPDVQIMGGPHIEFLLSASPAQVRQESLRILGSGITEGGRFILREGNNLAPQTPLENTEAMYYAAVEFGRTNPLQSP